MRSQIQAAEMSFLLRMPGQCLRDYAGGLCIQGELGIELLLHFRMSQLRWFGQLVRMLPLPPFGVFLGSKGRDYRSQRLRTPQDPPGGAGEGCLGSPAGPELGWMDDCYIYNINYIRFSIMTQPNLEEKFH